MNLTLHIDGAPVTLEKLARGKQEVRFTLNGKTYGFRGVRLPCGGFVLEQEMAPGVWGRQEGTRSSNGKNPSRVQLGLLEATISEQRPDAAHTPGEMPLSPRAPMPGLVRQIMVQPGDRVTRGQPLAVMEAMKLQLTLSAGGDGVVEAVLAQVGEMIGEGAELVKLMPVNKK